jgi:hypothetical protein
MTRLRMLYGVIVVCAAALNTAAARQQVQPGSTPPTEFVYIVTDDKATALYHRANCAWAKNATVRGFSEEEAKKRYFQPHCLCITGKEGMPPCASDPAVPAPAPSPTAPAAAAPVLPPAAAAPIRTAPPAKPAIGSR